ncbi:MAG: hypothetical protein ABR592_06225 [Nitriliruptorales bacterium]
MQLSAPLGALPPAGDVATALRVAATRLGHRPAVTMLRPDRRDEQGFASLAQWAAKGAHLLTLEAHLEPGDRLHIAMPVGWMAAAVCLAAWWLGVTVTVGPRVDGQGNSVDGRGNSVDGRGNRVEDRGGDADVAVVHESWQPPPGVSEVYAVGDAMDGTPLGPVDAEAWALAVQAFPDQPPSSRAEPDSVAVEFDGGTTWTQAELLQEAGRWGFEGALGVTVEKPPQAWLPALARPLLVGRPTVVLAGVPRELADAEGVGVWA